jgi:hypothetical protein
MESWKRCPCRESNDLLTCVRHFCPANTAIYCADLANLANLVSYMAAQTKPKTIIQSAPSPKGEKFCRKISSTVIEHHKYLYYKMRSVEHFLGGRLRLRIEIFYKIHGCSIIWIHRYAERKFYYKGHWPCSVTPRVYPIVIFLGCCCSVNLGKVTVKIPFSIEALTFSGYTTRMIRLWSSPNKEETYLQTRRYLDRARKGTSAPKESYSTLSTPQKKERK